MLIHVLKHCSSTERRRLKCFLAEPRLEHTESEVQWIYQLMARYKSISYARRAARELAGAALLEALTELRGAPDSKHKRFILEMVLYVVNRDR
jgi:geranylgeranyl pyrophosphate synthase